MSTSGEFVPFSLPRYSAATPGRQAAVYVLVSEGDELALRDARLAQFEPGTTQFHHLALPQYRDRQALGQALQALLQVGQVGLQLELVGDEAFVWQLQGLAREAGLLMEEIVLNGTQAGNRQLFCVHCATVQPASAASLHTCSHCGVQLEVRRHFSQRLGAYLGVCADADQPYVQVNHG